LHIILQADAIRNFIGFPQFILNASKLDDRYKQVRHASVFLVCARPFVWG